jgi:cell division protein FtsB
VSQDITGILRENRYLKEQVEYKDWECKELRDRVEFLEEEVRKLRFYVGER